MPPEDVFRNIFARKHIKASVNSSTDWLGERDKSDDEFCVPFDPHDDDYDDNNDEDDEDEDACWCTNWI